MHVVGQAEIAVFAVRVLPRNREHGEALVEQRLHQRVVRRQVEDVVLHDPRRNQQHRLGVRGARGRPVLDQLDQPVSIDHLARRARHRLADDESLAAGGRKVERFTRRIFGGVGGAALQVGGRFAQRAIEYDRIRPDAIRRRHRIEPLARCEADHLLVMARHAGNTGGGVLPPLLTEQKGLRERIERCGEPGRIGETFVLRQLRYAVRRLLRECAGVEQTQRVFHAELQQLQAFGRRRCKVNRPIRERRHQRGGRLTLGERPEQGMHEAIDGLVLQEQVRDGFAAAQPGAVAALACAAVAPGQRGGVGGRRGDVLHLLLDLLRHARQRSAGRPVCLDGNQ